MKKRFGAGKSYSDILTVLLVIIIIAILSLLGYFTYKVIHKNKVESDNLQGLDELHAAQEENKKWQNIISKNEVIEEPSDTNEVDVGGGSLVDYSNLTSNPSPENTTQTPSGNSNIKKAYLGKFEIKGEIYIPKTNCNYVILNSVSPEALSKSVGILDVVSNQEVNGVVNKDLNVLGTNAFILGHNYLNGQFFSNNDKLSIGDKIYITDQMGTKITYTIYDRFYTTSDDASFMLRDVDPNTREITLQTCNDNSTQRLIIFAKDN